MLAWRINFVARLMVVLVYLTGFGACIFCPSMASSCPLSFFESLYQCCSYAECNFFCGNCDAECRTKNGNATYCQYELEKNETFSIATEPFTRISPVLKCTRDVMIDCPLKNRIERTFEESHICDVSLPVALLRQIYVLFNIKYSSSVAEKTTTQLDYVCDIRPGCQGWLSQAPEFAVLTGAFIHKCCNKDHSLCTVLGRHKFSYRKPIVDATGFNVGNWSCEGDCRFGDDESKTTDENENKILEWMLVVTVLLSLVLLAVYLFRAFGVGEKLSNFQRQLLPPPYSALT